MGWPGRGPLGRELPGVVPGTGPRLPEGRGPRLPVGRGERAGAAGRVVVEAGAAAAGRRLGCVPWTGALGRIGCGPVWPGRTGICGPWRAPGCAGEVERGALVPGCWAAGVCGAAGRAAGTGGRWGAALGADAAAGGTGACGRGAAGTAGDVAGAAELTGDGAAAGAELACGAPAAVDGTAGRGAAAGVAAPGAIAGLGTAAGIAGAGAGLVRAGALGLAEVAAGAGSPSGSPCNFLRTFSATSTGMELECVFFSATP